MNIDSLLSGAYASSDAPKNTAENNTENKADNNHIHRNSIQIPALRCQDKHQTFRA